MGKRRRKQAETELAKAAANVQRSRAMWGQHVTELSLQGLVIKDLQEALPPSLVVLALASSVSILSLAGIGFVRHVEVSSSFSQKPFL
ncbi:hypothetical protein WISP_132369 [Willisornis vidua]|uniref:Uncharacterized protein n=1 Tax=Willisornis vidua TaxID=1566151 RepID=A0ABQ9CPC5_9PASS|nr:hypothetical protein WISP_132369 [Willisornis vidua]